MSRVERIAELTDLLTEDQQTEIFVAADQGIEALREYVSGLSLYSNRRRKRIIKMATRLIAEHSASLSPSASTSISPSASASASV
jgi:hypothetical protein